MDLAAFPCARRRLRRVFLLTPGSGRAVRRQPRVRIFTDEIIGRLS